MTKPMSKAAFVRRLADVIRAEAAGKDLKKGPHGVHVLAMRHDGTLYELGSVSAEMYYQDPDGARLLINRIKFAPHTIDHNAERARYLELRAEIVTLAKNGPAA